MMGGLLSIATANAGGKVAWVVPIYKNGRSLWHWCDNAVAPAKAARLVEVNKTERTIDFWNGGFLGIYSGDNEDSIRGEDFDLVIMDEAARISETAWIDAIMPTLADRDGQAILISTPKGRNWFYTEYLRGKESRIIQASFTAPSSNNPNPLIKRAAELAKTRVPERTYQQEWLAQFVQDGAYFQGVDAVATIEHPGIPERHEGHYLVMGVDWALSEDYTVITVGCRDCARVVDWARFNQLDFTYQREKLYAMADKWHIQGCLPERNSIGEPNIEIIRDRMTVLLGPDGKPGFNTSTTTKPMLIQGLATAIEQASIHIPKDYADELKSYEVETMASGHPKFSAPAGMHDDRVISLALAWYALTTSAVQLWI